MHIVSLSFDDGFKKSSIRTAEIYEMFGLAACFNVVATGNDLNWIVPAENIPMGGFDLWNELQDRGHEVMPHGYRHANKGTLSFEEGRGLILRCFDIFDEKLKGFDRKRAIFNFPYNRTTPELEAWLPTVVRAFRGGFIDAGVNPPPTKSTVALRTCGFGPGNCESHLDSCIAALLARPEGWLIYNTHGLDGEGWGPIGADYLERLLERLIKINTVRVLPTGVALQTI